MSDTEIKFELYYDDDSQILVGVFDSEMLAKKYATETRETEAQKYKIMSKITTRSVLDAFTVPAYVKSLEEIAQDIIFSSNGSFYMEWGEDIENLSDEDRRKVKDMVHAEISTCDCCGWHFHVDDMDDVDGEFLCWKCADDAENSDEDEEDED